MGICSVIMEMGMSGCFNDVLFVLSYLCDLWLNCWMALDVFHTARDFDCFCVSVGRHENDLQKAESRIDGEGRFAFLRRSMR